MKKSILYLALAGISMTAFYGCEDLENLCGIGEADLQTGDVFVKSLNHMIDVYKRVDEANKNPVVRAGGKEVIDGATCEIVGDSLFIDFGAGDVACADGKLRKGSIRARLLNVYILPTGEANAVLSNYHVDGTMISGSFDAKNDGPPTAPKFDITTTKFSVGEESAVDYTLDASWSQGFTTVNPDDDIFDVAGNVMGEDKTNVKNFTALMIEPLHYVTSCPDYLEKGIVEVELTGDSTVVFLIDFIESDGCNNLFQITADCDGNPLSFTYPMN